MRDYSRTELNNTIDEWILNEKYRAADGIRNYVRPDGSYADSSYARGRGAGAKRDAMGRYSSEGGVDEHTKEELRKLIEKM